MTEQEFLEKRIPIWLEGDDLHISRPSGTDSNNMHAYLSKKYGYNWMFAIRGYYWPGSHVQLYLGDYECVNCTVLVTSYIFQYFPDIKYIGIGCDKGKPGDIWPPKITIIRDLTYFKNEISDK